MQQDQTTPIELSESELRLQSEITNWMDHKITKILLNHLEQMNKDVWASFQTGLLLENKIEHAKIVGALLLARQISYFNSDEMVQELCQDTQQDKKQE